MRSLTHIKIPYKGAQHAIHHYTLLCQMTHIIQSSTDF